MNIDVLRQSSLFKLCLPPPARLVTTRAPLSEGHSHSKGGRQMSVVHVKDLAYVRLQSPDLDRAEEFLTHLGMVRSARTTDRLYMRGTDPSHHLHVTHLGPPKYLGLAFWVDGDAELKRLAQIEGASGVEHMDDPGGGR